MSSHKLTLRAVPPTSGDNAAYSAFLDARSAFLDAKAIIDFIAENDLSSRVTDEVFFALRSLVNKTDEQLEIVEGRFNEARPAGRSA